MIKKLMAFSGAIVLLFTACKKEQSVSEKVSGKWQIETAAIVDVNNGVTINNPYTGVAADYVDFRSDGKVYTSVNGSLDTSFYSIGNTQITFTDNNAAATVTIMDIQNLTNTSLQLYNKNVVSPDHYVETRFNLKK